MDLPMLKDWRHSPPSTTGYKRRLETSLLKGMINPWQKYAPRGKCAQVIGSELPEVVVSGPAGTGKSRSCMEKLNYCALHYPGSRYLMLRKTRASLSDSGLVTFENDVLGQMHPLVIDGPSRPHRWGYRYDNGSEIVVGGIDKPGRVLSTEYDLIYVQQAEELAENDWETLTTRLRHGRLPFQQIVGCCNPDRPTHWLRKRADAGRLLMLDSRHEENPVLWDLVSRTWTPAGTQYIARLDALTGVRKQRLRLGRWVQAEGMVYEGWDRAAHLIDPFPIPAEWRRIRAIDFGYTNALSCGFWAIDDDGRMYLYREIYMTRRTVAVHTRQIKELSEGEDIEATVCDHDAEDRATLEENGIPTVAADRAVSPGIQAVQERLKRAGDGRPRLFVMRDCLVERDALLAEAKKPTCTEEEIDGYVWPEDQAGRAVKEQPVKVDDHGMDGMRYAVMYVDQGGGSLLLWG